MRTQKSQFGITFLGFLIVIVVGSFFAYAAMKLVPVYSEYFGVVKSMKLVQAEAGIENRSIEEIRQLLNVQFDLQYVSDKDVPAKAITLVTANGQRSLNIAYQVDVPFIYNVDLLVSFNKTVDLTHGATY
jgi:hypothetical protein